MLKYISLRVYIYVLLLVLVLVGWISIVSAFAATLLVVLFSIEHELRIANLMLILMYGSKVVDEKDNNNPTHIEPNPEG
jgi:hypothetical protein